MHPESASGSRKRPRRSTVQEGQDQVATATDYTIFDNASTRTLMDLGSDTQDLSCSHITSEDEENNAVVKDPQYYFPEGDCAIRVGNTLFRVHKFLLARDSSAFQDMFDLPGKDVPCQSDKSQIEGYADRNPILLQSESEENFRVLLSVLYALPAELQAYRTNQADISRLLTICTTTNKYHFNTTEAWASSALYDVLSEEYGSIKDEYDLSYCSSSTMTKILEVAILCGHSDLKDLVQRLWVGRLWTNELNPLKAIRFANSHYDLDKLRGVASYVLLRRLDKKLRYDPDNDDNAESDDDATQDKDANATPERGPKLSDQERNSLLMGHISLTHLWDRVRSSPPRFERPDGCTYHQHGCLTTWTHIWDEVARSPTTLNNVKYQTMDVVGKLMSMKEQLFGNADLQCALTPGCRRRALESVRVLIKEVTDGLAEHFVTVS